MGNKKELIGIYVVAFLIGRVAVGSIYPFLTAFFLAAYIEGISSAGLFVMLLLGVASTLQFAAVIQYSIVVVLLMLILSCVQEKYLSDNRVFVGCIGGAVSFIGCLAALLIQGSFWDMPYLPFFEAFIAACGTIVYQMALSAMRNNPWNFIERNEAVISVVSLLVTVFSGLPVTVGSLFSVLAGVCFLTVFYGGFCYGITVGTMLGTVCGILMTLKTGEIAMLACMSLFGLVIGISRELGKLSGMAGVIVAYFFLGQLYDNTLFALPNVRAFISAVLVFMLIPRGLLYRQSRTQASIVMDLSVQQNVMEEFKQQLKEYGAAFRQLCGNFMSYNQINEDKSQSEYKEETEGMEADAAVSEAVVRDSYYDRMLKERDVMIDQMGYLGEMISSYADALHTGSPLSKEQEMKLKTTLWDRKILLNRLAVSESPEGRQRIYLYASRSKGRVITARELSSIVSRVLKKRLVVDEESRSIVGREESMIVLVEAPNFTYQSGYICHKKKGETLCGDYSYMAPVNRQSMLMVISDGMGSGEEAFRQSEFLTESIADLISAGFDKKHSIGLVNALMSLKYQGDNFATLDLCTVDLYSGVAEFVKYGAAVTFIKRDQWIDTIMSTSLPLGTVPDAKGDVAVKKLFGDDIIFMCSDGFMECIEAEDKVKCMKELICELEEESPEEMASELYRRVMKEQPEADAVLKDDATLVVFRLKAA